MHKKVPISFTRNKQILKTALKVVPSGHLKLGFIWVKLQRTPWHLCSDIFRLRRVFSSAQGTPSVGEELGLAQLLGLRLYGSEEKFSPIT
ncbi:hypothetical protein ACRRTK_001335 [Alexandromys fortis]